MFVRIAAVIWGFICCAVMAYFGAKWITDVSNPLRHELGIGFGIGLMYGWPAWLGLPILLYLGRKELPTKMKVLLSAPLALAVVLIVILGSAGGL